jgi:hypothetical protein
MKTPWRSILGLLVVMLFGSMLVACGGDDGEDRPGSVAVDPKSEVVSVSGVKSGTNSVSASGTGSASGTSSASGTGSASGTSSASGTGTGSASGTSTGGAVKDYDSISGYKPASDVTTHALVVKDVGEINALFTDPYDYSAINAIYTDGKNSVKSSGSVRTIKGAASAERSEDIWDDYVAYYGDANWLDTFVSSAIDGTGPFAGESDGVRKQGIQKGIQNQVMIAWAIHELVAALAKADDGNFDAEKGAPHNWDEAWAFYAGVEPGSGPFGTAEKRGGNFGTGTAVNDAILKAMDDGRDALLAGDVAGAQAASDEIIRQIQITYIQASIRYASKMTGDLESGDAEKARIHQAEGWAFFRVIAPMIYAVDPSAAAAIDGIYNLSNEPSDPGSIVIDALESTYSALGISPSEVGTLQ